jgi:xanthosine utilization system XapX-like protein
MLLSNGRRILIKVKADKVSKNKKKKSDTSFRHSQHKSQWKQISGQESQTGLGTKTNRWLTGLVSCKKTPPPTVTNVTAMGKTLGYKIVTHIFHFMRQNKFLIAIFIQCLFRVATLLGILNNIQQMNCLFNVLSSISKLFIKWALIYIRLLYANCRVALSFLFLYVTRASLLKEIMCVYFELTDIKLKQHVCKRAVLSQSV